MISAWANGWTEGCVLSYRPEQFRDKVDSARSLRNVLYHHAKRMQTSMHCTNRQITPLVHACTVYRYTPYNCMYKEPRVGIQIMQDRERARAREGGRQSGGERARERDRERACKTEIIRCPRNDAQGQMYNCEPTPAAGASVGFQAFRYSGSTILRSWDL